MTVPRPTDAKQLWLSRAPRFLGIAALLVAIVPFVVLARFAHPQADDFCNANTMRELGFWAAQKHWYTNWTGRFASTALILANPLAFGSLQRYKLIPVAMLCGLFLALFWLAREGLRRQLGPGAAAGWALAVLGVYLCRMASPAEGLYWYTGSVVYSASAVVALCAISATIRSHRSGSALSSWTWASVAGMFAVLAAGANEIAMLLLGLVLLLLTYVARRQRSPRWRVWLVPLTLNALAGVVAIVAPGNFKRAQMSGGLVSVLGPLAGSTAFTVASITEWLSSGPILVGALVILVYGIAASSDLQSDSPWRTTPWIIPTLATVFGIWGAFLFTHVASGIAFRPGPPPRVINVVFLFFLLMAMLSVYMAGLQLLGRFRPLASQLRSARAWTVLALAVTLFGDGNVREAYVDLISSRATTYDRELVDRYSTLRAASVRGESATVAALTRLPNSIFFRDITADSRDWRNVCYATFWKVPQVRVVRQP